VVVCALQLDMITDLLGAPSVEDVYHITSSMAVKTLISQAKPSALSKLYQLSSDTSHSAVHLLSQMLIFNPVRKAAIRRVAGIIGQGLFDIASRL